MCSPEIPVQFCRHGTTSTKCFRFRPAGGRMLMGCGGRLLWAVEKGSCCNLPWPGAGPDANGDRSSEARLRACTCVAAGSHVGLSREVAGNRWAIISEAPKVLLERDFAQVAWITPNEVLGDQIYTQDGGFAYLYAKCVDPETLRRLGPGCALTRSWCVRVAARQRGRSSQSFQRQIPCIQRR